MSSSSSSSGFRGTLSRAVLNWVPKSLRKLGSMSALTSTVIFFAMAAAERVLSTSEFQCPCNLDAMVPQTNKSKVEHVEEHFIWTYRFKYGMACIFIPAVALFFLAIILNPTTRILSTGFCHTRLASHWLLWRVLEKGLVVAIAWLFFALLNGDYVKCALTVKSCNASKSSKAKGVTKLNPEECVAMSRLLAFLVGLVAIVIYCCGNVLRRCCFTNSYHKECQKAKYKKRMLQQLEDIEKTTFTRLVELQLRKEGYFQLEDVPPSTCVKGEDDQREPLHREECETRESIPTIDGTEATTTAEGRNQGPLDRDIERLQKDLKNITSKIEDYNFSQRKLELELGYGGKKTEASALADSV